MLSGRMIAPQIEGRRVPEFLLVYEWPSVTKIPAETQQLTASSGEDAAVQAALSFASEEFAMGVPTSYSVFDGRGSLVFRFPAES